MKKILFFLLFLILVPLSSLLAQGTTGATSCGEDCQKIKKEHEALLADYNNVLAQAQALKAYKVKARDLEDSYRQFDIEREQLSKGKEDALAQAQGLREKIRELDEKIIRLNQERLEYKKSFEKASVENIMSEELRKKIASLEAEIASFSKKLDLSGEKIKLLDETLLKKQAEAELYKRQLVEAKSRYEEARQKNRALEKKVEEAPKGVAELARENKILIKRTAAMHYNLGVFYTQHKEFSRAIAEFEKAVELNPEDSASYFNLGYIYAEHLQNRPKAVEAFRKYLKLAKRDDKDMDWVKRYILTWQTWEGNIPIK